MTRAELRVVVVAVLAIAALVFVLVASDDPRVDDEPGVFPRVEAPHVLPRAPR